ncbi:MAG: carbon-nitrogen family hydrolase [Archaeoglobaceae archaeon]|nr:carbon-nitrogen family hydrolase [Archaeoglobaceae archaeon]
MRVALAQLRVSPDKDVNIMKALSLIKRSMQVNADLVVLPEVFNTGFFPHNYNLIGDLKEELEFILKLSEQKEIVIIGGVAERDGENLYNTAIVIHKGKIIGKYRKTHLFPLTSEKEYFTPGDKLTVFDTPVGKIGIMICYEIRFPEIARKLIRMGAEMLVVVAEFPPQRIEHWSVLLRARAIENQVYVVGVNCVEGDLKYPGKSMLVDPLGKVVIEAGNVQEVVMADIDLGLVKEVREKFPFLNDLREEIVK